MPAPLDPEALEAASSLQAFRVEAIAFESGRLHRRGLCLRWKLLWIQKPRLFRMLVALNDRLPYRARFVRNPTVTLR